MTGFYLAVLSHPTGAPETFMVYLEVFMKIMIVISSMGRFSIIHIITIFPKPKRIWLYCRGSVAYFFSLRADMTKNAAVNFGLHCHCFHYFSAIIILSKIVAVIARVDCRVFCHISS